MSLSSFLAELRRRYVVRVAVGYGIVAFAVGEAADVFFPALSLPGWSVTLVVALLVLGFPVALVLAWTLEVTPEGVVKDTGRRTSTQREKAASPGGEASTTAPGAAPQATADADAVSPTAADAAAISPTTAAAEPSPGPSERSVAVLAFTDMSAEGDQEYLGDGIAEEIIDALTKLPGLNVAARTSSFGFKGRREDVREIGRKLGVATVLEGSVRKAGNRLRITSQLVSVADGYHLWSERYDRELDDVFEIQDQIAHAVVEALRVELLGEGEDLVLSTTDDAEAYDQYLKGRHAWRRRYQLGLESAMRHFERAIELDPEFAEPWAGITDTCSVLALYGFGDLDELRQRATEAVRRALDGGPHLADVRFSAGLYELVFGWSVPKGLEHFREAIRLGGRHPRSRAWLGVGLVCQGRDDEAYAESRGALEEAPESTYLRNVHGLVCTCTERFAEARASFEAVLETDPSDFLAWYGLGIVESWEGRHSEAIRRLRFVSERAGRTTGFQTMLAGALARAGRRDEAEQIIAGLRAERDAGLPDFGGYPFYYAWAGDVDRAFQALRRAAEERIPGTLPGLWFPWYRPMRQDPRWAILEPFLEGE